MARKYQCTECRRLALPGMHHCSKHATPEEVGEFVKRYDYKLNKIKKGVEKKVNRIYSTLCEIQDLLY